MEVRGSLPSLIAYVSQKRGGPCNCRLREDEMKRQLFNLLCRCGCLFSFVCSLWLFAGSLVICSHLVVISGCLLVVCGSLLVVYGSLLVVYGGLCSLLVVCWSFVLVCSHCPRLWPLPVLVICKFFELLGSVLLELLLLLFMPYFGFSLSLSLQLIGFILLYFD